MINVVYFKPERPPAYQELETYAKQASSSDNSYADPCGECRDYYTKTCEATKIKVSSYYRVIK